VAGVLDRAREALQREARAYVWPAPGRVAGAVNDACGGLKQRISSAAGPEGVALRAGYAKRFWNAHGSLWTWRWDELVIRRLVADGVDARALWRSGADVPAELLATDGNGATGTRTAA
jgi:hypothetical protein